MRSAKFFMIVVVMAVMVVACMRPAISGSGNVVGKKYEFSGFTRIEAGNAFRLSITRGDDFSCVVHLDDNLMKYLRMSQKGETLEIGMDGRRNYSVHEDSMRVEISMPSLKGLDLSGASHAEINGFESGDDLKIEASGASFVKGQIVAGRISLDLSGASSVKLTGSAESLELEASGASRARLAGFSAGRGQTDLSGASEATVNVTGKLDISASGASDLAYLGNPTLGRVSTSGASSISKQ
jgi:hypothetical protein